MESGVPDAGFAASGRAGALLARSNLSTSPRITVASSPGIRIILTGRGQSPWRTSPAGLASTIPRARTAAFITFREATAGTCFRLPGLADDMNSIQSVLTDEQKEEFKPVAIELKKGEASFHHPLMVHGSFENKTDRPRRATVINVFRDGVVSDSDEPPLAGVPAIPPARRCRDNSFRCCLIPPQSNVFSR